MKNTPSSSVRRRGRNKGRLGGEDEAIWLSIARGYIVATCEWLVQCAYCKENAYRRFHKGNIYLENNAKSILRDIFHLKYHTDVIQKKIINKNVFNNRFLHLSKSCLKNPKC